MAAHDELSMEFFDSHELFEGESCGVFVFDGVEEDDLYPFTPHWRARKDGQSGQKELVVSMATGKFKKLYRSRYAFATAPAEEQMRERERYGLDAEMIEMMRDILDQK